jgi:hypothetical protein
MVKMGSLAEPQNVAQMVATVRLGDRVMKSSDQMLRLLLRRVSFPLHIPHKHRQFRGIHRAPSLRGLLEGILH